MSREGVHPLAACETDDVGHGTRIAAFAHVEEGAVIGAHCELGEHVSIRRGVVIGNGVRIEAGAQAWLGVVVEDDVTIGPNVTLGADSFDHKSPPEARTIVHARACLGANATIFRGVNVGQNARIGPGSVVNRTVPANSVVVGNPARISGYVDSAPAAEPVKMVRPVPQEFEGVRRTGVRGVTLHQLPRIIDMRGILSVGEFERDIPFPVRRYFMVFDVESEEVRGEHAHRACHQFLVCVSGSTAVVADDGETREEFLLSDPSIGIYLPPMVWATQYKYSADAKLLVFASDYYDPDDYIRDYEQFLAELRGGRP